MNAQISKKETFIIPLIIGVLIAGALAWYFWPKLQQKSTEVPPSITISSSKFQGLISGGDVCKIPGIYAFTDAQVSSYIKPGADNAANWNTLEQGVHIYHAGVDMTVQEIMNAIVPTTGNKIMIAYYPADTENAEKKFVTYPGIAGQTEIGKPEAYSIPANQGFEIFSCQDTKIWKIRTEKMGADAVTPILNTKDAGWILIPVATGKEGLLNDYKNKIKSAWFQKGPGFDFQKVENMDNAQLIGDWKMIWLKIGPVEPAAGAAPDTVLSLEIIGKKQDQVNIDQIWNGIASFLDLSLSINKDSTINEINFSKSNISAEIDKLEEILFVIGEINEDTMKIENIQELKGVVIKNPDTIRIEINPQISLDANQKYYIGMIPKIPANTAGGTKYQIGIAKKDDIKFRDVNGNNLEVGSLAEFPLYGNVYAVQQDAAAIPKTITVNKKEGFNKQVVIEWTDNAPADVNKYLIYRSEKTPVDTSIGQFVDSNPPGNLVGNPVKTDGTETFTDTLLLKDNTKYHYIIKSRQSGIGGKVLGTSEEFSVTTTALPPLQ